MPDTRDLMRKFLSDYGMLAVLLLLCLFFSLLTLKQQQPQGEAAAEQLSEGVQEKASAGELVLVVAGSQQASQETAQMVSRMLRERSFSQVREIVGTPRDLRVVLDQLRERGEGPG